MPAAPQGVVIEPNGQTVVVTFVELGGGTPTVYADRNGQSTIALPATITVRTKFFFEVGTVYTVSCKVSGLENANGAGGTATVDLTGGGVASLGVSTPVETPTVASGTYAPIGLRVRRLSPRPITVIDPAIVTVTDVASHGIASAVQINATVAENAYMTKCAGGSFVDIGSGRITAGHTNPGTAIRDPFAVEFWFYGLACAIPITSAPGNQWRAWVDDQIVGAWAPVVGAGGGATRYIKFTFAATGLHKIRYEQVNGDVYGVVMGPTDSIGRTKPRGPRCIIVGDSYTQSAAVYSAISSWVETFAEYMGWDDVWNSGIGGTGWVAGSPNFQARAAGIVAQAPDIVILAAGKNDTGSTPAQVGAAVGNVMSTLRAGLPNAQLVVVGPIFPAAPLAPTAETSFWLPYQTAIFAAAAPYGAITIDTCASSIFTGTGKAGTLTGTGNGDVFIQSDATHPTVAGAAYLGSRLAAKIAAVIP